ncbi:Hemolysin-type calcium-binding repeat-containing protein [Roseivivax lentus]|uniref:Hemolysin-type calcium-binding repeat-containing protein n=1 Tax=Roseivivax lentus TaxID=633194 RepID=A0A1N7M020_9RHOB|nr:Hint domain-containing protein [Roseivivax lentus]SIS79426.1 Hemolysin-type calcium-binding repeat-containing protein [Roseivivax lentus]
MATFWARFDSNSANNPALNLRGDAAIEFTFVESGPTGDLALDTNGGLPDPDTQVSIDGVLYDFTFELSAQLPTLKRDGAGQVPDQYEGATTYIITVQDYPAPGDTTRLAFLPDENATQAEMDAFGNGAIDLQNVGTDPVPDYVVEGTSGDDVIDATYGGDLEGDRIDNNDGNPLQPGSAGGDDDSVTAGAGNDYVASGAGNDTVLGEDGADTLDGGAGADVLSGGLGDDFLLGGLGADTLDGGAGNDVLAGGDGNDLFVLSDGNDTITDFNSGNTGPLGDGDSTNNDFLDLSNYYDSLDELRADLLDDGILNQSNTLDDEGNAVDYSDNTQFGTNSLTVQGATGSTFSYDNTGIVCFTSGTHIATPDGEVPIDTLRVGDLVCTFDNGPQPITWIGRRQIGREELEAHVSLRPVLIRKGALGNKRDLLVSRQHGMLIGEGFLVRAAHLAAYGKGIRIAHGKRAVTYIHLMFASHQIIFAEGIPSESFFPGPMALQLMSPDAQSDLWTAFPTLKEIGSLEDAEACYGRLVRPFAKKRRVEALLNATKSFQRPERRAGSGPGTVRAA